MNEMKEEGRSIRKTKEAWRADYKTTTTIKVMSDSEAKSSVPSFFSNTKRYLSLLADNSRKPTQLIEKENYLFNM